jgi:glycerate 2-kinase
MNDARRRVKEQALDIFQSCVASVDPKAVVKQALSDLAKNIDGRFRVYVVGMGKAALPMLEAAHEIMGDRIAGCIGVTKYGHGDPAARFEIIEAGHPVPDENGAAATGRIIDMVTGRSREDLVLVLISGGGSALTSLPAEGLALADLAQTNRLLIDSSADIHEINTVRKHLSAFSGGRLVQYAHPARLVSLILSDVVGDDISVIASGPTAPDPTTFADAMDVLARYGLTELVPRPVAQHLAAGEKSLVPETPKPGDPIFDGVINTVVGNAAAALTAAHKRAGDLGYAPLVLSSSFTGDTHELARFHAAIAREVSHNNRPVPPPACLISGGETTVAVMGSGVGGRNTECALAFARETQGAGGVFGLFCGSDGTDGPTEAAGAFTAFDTVARAHKKGLDATEYLKNNDSYTFFNALGDLIVTGPTRTNVMDIRLVFITGEAAR